MKILGIDPGTLIVGYGVLQNQDSEWIVETSGIIKAKRTDKIHMRLKEIYSKIVEIISQHTPQILAIEKAFYGKNVQSAIRIGEGRAVAMLAATQADMQVYEYEPTLIKKSVTGNGRAHKEQIQYMVGSILGIERPLSSDEADALAIAICCYNHIQWENAI